MSATQAAPTSGAVRRAYVALGSNLGDSQALLTGALAGLTRLGTLVQVSGFYRTAPLGPPQPDYLNAAAALDTTLSAAQLVSELKAIERALGRTAGPRWGPRLIDLDLLLLDGDITDTETATVPHPELHHRAFVLVPLCEVAPEVRHPILGQTMRALCAALPADAVAAVRAQRLGAAPPLDTLKVPR